MDNNAVLHVRRKGTFGRGAKGYPATPPDLNVRPSPLKSEKPEGDVGPLTTFCLAGDSNGLFESLSEYGDRESLPPSSLGEGSYLWTVPRRAKVGTQCSRKKIDK